MKLDDSFSACGKSRALAERIRVDDIFNGVDFEYWETFRDEMVLDTLVSQLRFPHLVARQEKKGS